MSESSKLYSTDRALKRSLRVAYPAGKGRIVLRTELDWEADVEPASVSEDGTISTFEIESTQPFLYFKACLLRDGETRWSLGPNRLLLMTEADRRKHCALVRDGLGWLSLCRIT